MTRAPVERPRDSRVLLLMLTDRDATTSRDLLQKVDVEVDICESFDALLLELERGAATIAIAEERMGSSTGSIRSGAAVRDKLGAD